MARRIVRVFHLTLREPGQPPQPVRVDRLPFVIGRAAGASLQVQAPGVWDRHLIVDLDKEQGVMAEAGPSATITLEDRPVGRHPVRAGEILGLGAVTVEFLLSPLERRRLGAWEVGVWVLWMAVAAVEVVLVTRFLP